MPPLFCEPTHPALEPSSHPLGLPSPAAEEPTPGQVCSGHIVIHLMHNVWVWLWFSWDSLAQGQGQSETSLGWGGCKLRPGVGLLRVRAWDLV